MIPDNRLHQGFIILVHSRNGLEHMAQSDASVLALLRGNGQALEGIFTLRLGSRDHGPDGGTQAHGGGAPPPFLVIQTLGSTAHHGAGIERNAHRGGGLDLGVKRLQPGQQTGHVHELVHVIVEIRALGFIRVAIVAIVMLPAFQIAASGQGMSTLLANKASSAAVASMAYMAANPASSCSLACSSAQLPEDR